MKSRSKELLDKAIAAMIAAIEIYNKPDFQYRGETFSILAINSWELLLKAKWLDENHNKVRSLYVMEFQKKKDGSKSKQMRLRRTRSGNPFTHSLDHLAKKLIEQGHFNQNAWTNIRALLELRDSSVHFYNRSDEFAKKLQEIGTASVKNFVLVANNWFNRDLGEFNFYLMPLSFMPLPQSTDAIVSKKEEENFLRFVEHLEAETDQSDSKFSVTLNIDVKFTRSKEKGALSVQTTLNPDAPEVRITDEQIRERYPWDYKKLTAECHKRYSNFKSNKNYHKIRKSICENDGKLCKIRFLDPGNPKSISKPFYNSNILQEFDKCYLRKQPMDSK